ncbi:MAG: hypothetical protein U0M60_07420 [Clostridia bacterium]|nr:hypothetical protein [Clostridia bacterium]
MKKIFLIIAISVIALMCFAACDNPVEKNTHLGNSDFVMVESTDDFYIVYHKETKVMYAVSDSSYNHGNFTLLVNADGTPMTYKK